MSKLASLQLRCVNRPMALYSERSYYDPIFKKGNGQRLIILLGRGAWGRLTNQEAWTYHDAWVSPGPGCDLVLPTDFGSRLSLLLQLRLSALVWTHRPLLAHCASVVLSLPPTSRPFSRSSTSLMHQDTHSSLTCLNGPVEKPVNLLGVR